MLEMIAYAVLLLVVVPALILGLAKAISVYVPGGTGRRARGPDSKLPPSV